MGRVKKEADYSREEIGRRFHVELGLRVAKRREQLGMTQDTLARELRLSRSSVANLETGRQKIAAETLAWLCLLLEIPIQDLMPPIEGTFLWEQKIRESFPPSMWDGMREVLNKARAELDSP
jgi:transcriptional regulator with XRE-family HTH domain